MNSSSALALTVTAVLAETPAFDQTAFARYGLPGLVIAWFIWRDYRQTQATEKRQESQDAKFDQMVQSVSSLVRVTGMEVMSRPQVVARAKAEVEEILSKLPPQ